ncbi:putative undecaprenyl diphosphate synthase-domain-containing protein [Scenedesmus sp. NREL 46B-D3]|nr:putative undecaprenyl diphosphate synthase-domain-containing protein [Scenedesmus sp. NREL 46B-D3]
MLPCIRRLVALLLTGQQLPQHVAFIMDGNRRFADQFGLQRIDGHTQGYNKMKEMVQWCLELGIACVSVYAFSIDNFRRPQQEVDALMELAAAKFEELLHDEDAKRWQAELRVVGDLSRAPPAIQAAAARLMQGSKEQGPTRAVVNICFSYTSSQELQHAVQQVAAGVGQSQLLLDDVTPGLLQQVMHTRECPPVDLLIRTSGEQRLSDFLLWQSSHALLHWERCLWPEFGYTHLLRALLTWQAAAADLAQLRRAAAAATAAEVAAQQRAAAQLSGASSPPRVVWADAGLQEAVQQQLLCASSLLQQQQQDSRELPDKPPPPQRWWSSAGSWGSAAGSDAGSGAGSSGGGSPAGGSPQRAPSASLSMISEDAATYCPHPCSQLRVDSYVARLEQQHASRLQLLATAS